MAHYLLVRISDDKIVSCCSSSVSSTGHRVIDTDSPSPAFSGDAIPADKRKMAGGSLTTGNSYSAPAANPAAARRYAWDAAKLDYYTDEAFDVTISAPLELKIKSNDKPAVTAAEWTELTGLYPEI